ncbi:copper resistance protein B [Limibaculum sp. M0105]|uniref:Copper resistance protein B n=1 Tax=Thermohalobaculum xanthum TaxID=2753746 RepID=A0A8J7SCK6_9RHOB|nr:copper resistance protein B [Thermohalobaculum xanthum]MBK0399482.1 copper resistance protein B [Thermohalobaculum xanthum]
MTLRSLLAGALAPALLGAPAALAEPLIWGIQVEQLEYRVGDETDVFAWDFDAMVGTDELKLVWRSEAEYAMAEDAFEKLENQLRLQVPVSEFFDAVAGVRVDTPDGPDRVHGVIGLHGLAPQWFEVDADLFISGKPFARLEGEYEALLTNRIILIPSIEFELPFTDDTANGVGAWGPRLEVGARLSYDLVDRAVAPYIGVHYERSFGETADLARAGGEDPGAVFFVSGVRLMF